jgi:squalene-hopene/tetraprenyl-beta-curcumene cyclase
LAARQRPDGPWVPLWFGNQHHPQEENPVYGTARVVMAYRDLGLLDTEPARRGLNWLATHQDPGGGWGGSAMAGPAGAPATSSVEETALAVEALLAAGPDPATEPATTKGLTWLVQAVESGRHREAAPIGLYFARLWYYERLYPLCFTLSALGQAVRRLPEDRLPKS